MMYGFDCVVNLQRLQWRGRGGTYAVPRKARDRYLRDELEAGILRLRESRPAATRFAQNDNSFLV